MDARIVDGRKIARVTDDGKLKVLVHGRDGDDLVPVKVSEDGYLMLATDVTVGGVTVDLGTVELNQGAPGQNPWPVTLFDTLRTPAVGRRTVTATAAELFAGASRLASRRRLVIRNEDPVLRCLIGPATVSQQTGFPIEPGAVLEVPCDPEVAVPVYAISEGASLTVAVMEI